MGNGRGRIPRVSDEEILAVFQDAADPVLTAGEVAEQLPIGRRGTLTRLKSLAEDDRLQSKKVGSRSTVWWQPDQ